jgi:hypothetical protein
MKAMSRVCNKQTSKKANTEMKGKEQLESSKWPKRSSLDQANDKTEAAWIKPTTKEKQLESSKWPKRSSLNQANDKTEAAWIKQMTKEKQLESSKWHPAMQLIILRNSTETHLHTTSDNEWLAPHEKQMFSCNDIFDHLEWAESIPATRESMRKGSTIKISDMKKT